MRAAALHLAFALGAERVTSTTFADNGPSHRVSAKFGYTPNGVRRVAVNGQLIHAHELIITSERWTAHKDPGIRVGDLELCRTMFDPP